MVLILFSSTRMMRFTQGDGIPSRSWWPVTPTLILLNPILKHELAIELTEVSQQDITGSFSGPV
jgi:hypothetical protein